MIFSDSFALTITVSVALMSVIIVCVNVRDTLYPYSSIRLGVDPALATGPFITTSNDIMGIADLHDCGTDRYTGYSADNQKEKPIASTGFILEADRAGEYPATTPMIIDTNRPRKIFPAVREISRSKR